MVSRTKWEYKTVINARIKSLRTYAAKTRRITKSPNWPRKLSNVVNSTPTPTTSPHSPHQTSSPAQPESPARLHRRALLAFFAVTCAPSRHPHRFSPRQRVRAGRFNHGDFAAPGALLHQRDVLGPYAGQRVGGDRAIQCQVGIMDAKYACSPRITCATSYYIDSKKCNLNPIFLSTKSNRRITKRSQD